MLRLNGLSMFGRCSLYLLDAGDFLQQPAFLEAVPSDRIRVGFGVADDYVIEDGNAHRFGSILQLTGYFDIRCARGGVPARVIVDADYGTGSETYGFSKHFSRVNEAVAGRAGSRLANSE